VSELPDIPPGHVPLVAPCAMCGGEIHTHYDPVGAWAVPKLLKSMACESCIDSATGTEMAKQAAERLERQSATWETLCPYEFKKPIDWTKCKIAHSDRIMAWQFGAVGLYVHGVTGLSKTRFLFRLMHREWLAGKTCAFVAHPDFRREVGYLAQTDQAAMWRYANVLLKVDVLMFDDLGAGVVTAAGEEAFEWLLAKRCRNGKPILFSSNVDTGRVGKLFSEERRMPIVRRIVEFTKEIAL
jgi:DNA replication protein DnaC